MATLRPTFSESWYRVADLKARLRPSAQISRQFYRGDRWYVVRDPAGNQYHRLSSPAYRFVGLLDGTRTVSEAWELVGGQLADDAPTQNEVIQILSQLHAANLMESNVTPDAAVLLRRHKKLQKKQWQGRLMNVLFPRIPLWDLDQFLVRWMPVMRVFLSWFGVVLWLAVVGWAIAALAPEWPRLKSAASNAMAPSNWPFLWATFVVTKLIHELGHGFTCRRFRGEVHELGVMFLVMVPAPYVDASSAWAFPSKWQKILVGAGGMIFELFVAAIMAFVWLYTSPTSVFLGIPVNQLAYNTMLIASVSTVIFNANPLLRYDGYYMLSDYLEIPNLRYRSSEYTLGIIKRHLFGVKLPQPLPPFGQRIWLFLYAVLSTVYRTWVGIMIIFLVWTQVPVLGALMAIGGVITWLVVPVVKTSKYLMIDPELHRKRARATLWVGASVAAACVLVGVIPFRMPLQAVGVLEPVHKHVVHAGENGRINQILVRDGQAVTKGQDLLVCTDKELEIEINRTRTQIEGAEYEYQQSLMQRGPDVNVILARISVLKEELAKALEREAQLRVKAPIDGVVIAPDLREYQDRYVQRGDELLTVAAMDQLRITALVDQEDAALTYLVRPADDRVEEIQYQQEAPRKAVGVRLAGEKSRSMTAHFDPSRAPTYTMELPSPALGHLGGGDAAIDPSDENGTRLLRPQVQFWLNLDGEVANVLPGQRVYLKVDLKEEPLIRWASRRIWQLIQANTQSKWI